MKTYFEPLHDMVLLDLGIKDNVTEGGIVIPGKEKRDTGVVAAVGKGYITDSGAMRPLTVKVGDVVYVGDNYGLPVKQNGQEFELFRERDILGIIQTEVNTED